MTLKPGDIWTWEGVRYIVVRCELVTSRNAKGQVFSYTALDVRPI